MEALLFEGVLNTLDELVGCAISSFFNRLTLEKGLLP